MVEGAGRLDAALPVTIRAHHLADDAVGQGVAQLVGVAGKDPLRNGRVHVVHVDLHRWLQYLIGFQWPALSSAGIGVTGQPSWAQKLPSQPSSSPTRTRGRLRRRRSTSAVGIFCTSPSVITTARTTP